jgi:hypothetical protein
METGAAGRASLDGIAKPPDLEAVFLATGTS